MPKLKFIAFSDQHLEKNLYNLPELGKDLQKLFSMVIDTAIEQKVDYITSVGDLFDNNRPSSETIRFVSQELARLKAAGITPVALAGDHSKPINGATWETVCGFLPINSVPEFVGVDYSDNPADVLELINHELRTRPANTVKFIFIHGQIPELWPFCEEKKMIHLKDIDLSRHCESITAIFLGDIHIRRDMRYMDIACNKNIFVGYCGSLGVTAGDETKKEGLYYWDGDTLQIVEYDLPRKFITIDIRPGDERVFDPAAYNHVKEEKNRPVFLGKLYDGVEVGAKLNFLYDLGYVRLSKVKKDAEGREELVNIRSELKTGDRFSAVISGLLQGDSNAEVASILALKLLTETEPKAVLDEFKQAVYGV